MKKFSVRKRLLALLISSNIVLTGCSILGDITSKNKEDSVDSSCTQSSTLENISILESRYEDNQNTESSLNKKNDNEQTSAESNEESKKQVESSIIEETEEESNEIYETESSAEEESTEIDEETSVEENSESYSSVENEINEDSYEEESSEEEFDNFNNEVYTYDNTYIRAKTTVNVRSEPNTNSDILSLLYEGNVLKKVGYIDNWYIVEYDGKNAYVSKDYADEIEESKIKIDLNESNICYFPYGTVLFTDKEFTNKLLDIPSLESGEIINQEGNAYYVNTAGYNGYVNISSATVIPQPVVIVDKSEQILRLYKNNKKLMEFPVVTGNETSNFYHPSGEGLFNIYSKSYNAELVGDTWDVVVNVFMGYNGGEGIHDAVWRSYFGGECYLGDGSHGCINCPYNEVMNLASEVEVGDKVLVKR